MRPGRALVTGGGARLGRNIALWLGAQGWDVAVHYHTSEEGARQVTDAIPGRGAALQADLLDDAATQTLIPRAAEALEGPLTLLVNSASIFEHDTLRTATIQSWDRHIGSNLKAPFLLTQAFAAQAPEVGQDQGEPVATALIVNMVDQRVRKLTPEFMTYTLAKMGLWTLTQTAAQGLAPGIRVNAIGPGPTMRGTRQSPDHFARQRAATILQRGADPGGICGALGYLIGADAVTGQLICVDGGQHLVWRTADILGLE